MFCIFYNYSTKKTVVKVVWKKYIFALCFGIHITGDKMKKDKSKVESFDYYFGRPRLEMDGNRCLVDGLKSIVEYSDDKITVSLGKQIITFFGDDLHINSFTREGAVIEGNIISMEFSEC